MSQQHNDTKRQDAEGNTNPRRARRWCMTINNPTKDEDKTIEKEMEARGYKYIIGNEVGKEGTPHLQIYIEAKNAIAFDTLKRRYPRAHIEKAKGTGMQNLAYCSKEGQFKTNIKKIVPMKETILKIYENVEWHDWQHMILKTIETVPDDRTINWIVDIEGAAGKSFLCKYIYCKHEGVIIAEGKRSDVYNQILTLMQNSEFIPKIILIDVPRHNMEYFNYGTLERIKDGLIYSGKYEGGICVFPSPHVFVFANFEPDESKYTNDRWNIIRLGKKVDTIEDLALAITGGSIVQSFPL